MNQIEKKQENLMHQRLDADAEQDSLVQDLRQRLSRLEQRVERNENVAEFNKEMVQLKSTDEEVKDGRIDELSDKVESTRAQLLKVQKHCEVVAKEMDCLVQKFKAVQTNFEERIDQTLQLEHVVQQGQVLRDEQMELFTKETFHRLDDLDARYDGHTTKSKKQLEIFLALISRIIL